MTSTAPPTSRGAILRVAGSVGILVLLALLLPVEQVLGQMRSVGLTVWLTVLTGFLAVQLVGAVKFHLLLAASGAALPFALSLRCAFAALFGNSFLPSIVGGDLISVGLAMHYTGARAAVAVAASVNRMLDFAALGVLAIVGAVAMTGSLVDEGRRMLLTVFAGLAGAALVAIAVLWVLLRRRYSVRMRRRLVRLRQAVRALRHRSGRVAAILLVAIAMQLCLLGLVAMLGRRAGLELSFALWCFAWPLSKLAALAPISVGGIGAREAAFAAIALPFGVPATHAVAVGLLYQTVSLAGGAIAGVVSSLLGRTPQRSAAARTSP